MKSYTNRKGEKVEVTKEHLDTAVKIKIELQKASPSGRCSWRQLVKMMEEEGFNDAENSENYRCMIKDYQKSIGELPQVEKYADMIADKKLDSIKNLVGEYAYVKREAQNEFRKLNKVRRDIIDYTLFTEQIANAFNNHDFSHLHFKYKPIVSKTDKKMIVGLSDLHIGALVDIHLNKYNFEIATARMKDYMNKVIAEAKAQEITDIYLINLGDAIEHPYMHNLAYSCEFPLQEQILMASDLIIKFMMGLADEKLNVTVAGIAGNHDRLNSDKKKNINGDHAVKGVNQAIKSFIENAKVERIAYQQAKDYEHSISVNGLNVKFVHGDLDNPRDKNVVAKHSSLDGVDYSLIVMGHYHHFEIIEVGINKAVVVFGSMKGADSYGENGRLVSAPSQGIILVDENGDYEVKQIKISA